MNNNCDKNRNKSQKSNMACNNESKVIVKIVEPNITYEENEKRIRQLESTMSYLFKRKITISIKN